MQIDKMSNELKTELHQLDVPKEKQIIQNAIVKWSDRVGFCDHLSGMIYKMVQAVKAIFGCSDWQKAVNQVEKSLTIKDTARDYRQLAMNDLTHLLRKNNEYIQAQVNQQKRLHAIMTIVE